MKINNRKNVEMTFHHITKAQMKAQMMTRKHTYSPQQLLPSTLAGAYFRSVSRQWGVDRRPKDVCERGMVSDIRIIVSHFLGPNNL